jgi:hypothetical protein
MIRSTHNLKITFLILFLFLTGCSAVGPKFNNAINLTSDEGVLYIFRPDGQDLQILDAEIKIDNKKVGLIGDNEYMALPLKTGKHKVSFSWKAGFLGNKKLEAAEPVVKYINIVNSKSHYMVIAASAITHTSQQVLNSRFTWGIEEISRYKASRDITHCTLAINE